MTSGEVVGEVAAGPKGNGRSTAPGGYDAYAHVRRTAPSCPARSRSKRDDSSSLPGIAGRDLATNGTSSRLVKSCFDRIKALQATLTQIGSAKAAGMTNRLLVDGNLNLPHGK